MPATGDQQLLQSIAEIPWEELIKNRSYFPSPHRWDDELIYFLLVDRFSDGREAGGYADGQGQPVQASPGRTTPLFSFSVDAYSAERGTWFESGKNFCGGHLAGVRSKLGYLKRLGITAIWLSPVFKNVPWDSGCYHGYGVQNFLDIDPRFGTKEDLKLLVEEAHDQGIRVILDIIFNHSGNVFEYDADRYFTSKDGKPLDHPDPRWDRHPYRVKGWRDASGQATLPFGVLDPSDQNHWPDAGIWPRELQTPDTFTLRGRISNWDYDPEFLEGDFDGSLKDLNHGQADVQPDLLKRAESFKPAPALFNLAKSFNYWIAYADIDGFRIDTVKHMEPGAVRIFASIIHEFAQKLGKERFYLIGEITGGRKRAVEVMRSTGIDAALGIDDIPDKLEFLAKGYRSPGQYFQLFRNSVLDGLEGHQWYGEHIVTSFDDHDQVGEKHKFRFAGDKVNEGWKYLKLALGINLLTLGIPCVYYGTEQAFDGRDQRTGNEGDSYSDVFLRECMFGGPFGSLQSKGRHFFDESHELYRFIAGLAALRASHMPLRRGRQYLRPVSEDGTTFFIPEMIGSVFRYGFAWSRIFADQEVLIAANTSPDHSSQLWFTLDQSLTPPGTPLRCLFSNDQSQVGSTVVAEARNGSAARLCVPEAGICAWGHA